MRNRLQLSPKVSNKVSIKNTLVFASAGIGIFLLLFTGAFFYLNLGNSEEVLAAPPLTSRNNNTGTWENGLDWMGNTAPDVNLGKDAIININGFIKRTGDLSFNKNASLTINDTLIIEGSISLDKEATLNIGANGTLIVLGNYTSDKSLSIANGGKIVITGEVSLAKDASISNNGDIYFYDSSPNYGTNFSYDGTPIGDQNDLAANDPSLYILVNGGDGSLLPIVLDYFNATLNHDNSISITWGTVTEKDNDFFTLERSSDGKTFEVISTVDGAGNSDKKLDYSFEDQKATQGMNYYRLKQTDFNGDFEYFKIVGVNNPNAATQQASAESIAGIQELQINKAWPNPFKSTVNLSFDAEDEGEVEVLIQNSMGEIVHKEEFSYYYGENTYTFDRASDFRPGIYFVTLWQNGKKLNTLRVIKG